MTFAFQRNPSRVGVADLFDGPDDAVAGVVEQQVDTDELVGGGSDRCGDAELVGQVERDGQKSIVCGQLIGDRLGPAGGDAP